MCVHYVRGEDYKEVLKMKPLKLTRQGEGAKMTWRVSTEENLTEIGLLWGDAKNKAKGKQ